jgi:hypothetical protein
MRSGASLRGPSLQDVKAYGYADHYRIRLRVGPFWQRLQFSLQNLRMVHVSKGCESNGCHLECRNRPPLLRGSLNGSYAVRSLFPTTALSETKPHPGSLAASASTGINLFSRILLTVSRMSPPRRFPSHRNRRLSQ